VGKLYYYAVTVCYVIMPCVHQVQPASPLHVCSSHCTPWEERLAGAIPLVLLFWGEYPMQAETPPQNSPDSHGRAVLSFTPHTHIC